MERTIYSKYSNERAKRFGIRTDIVTDESGEKKVYKYALNEAAEDHIRHIAHVYPHLARAYAHSPVAFCTAELVAGERCAVKSPFAEGASLQNLLEQAAGAHDGERIEALLREYVHRVMTYGGDEPFAVTPEFTEVFSGCAPDYEVLEGMSCAAASDIDMIFSNILTEEEKTDAEAVWNVIDYEWTFLFPIPKLFLIYRAFYFAWHQIFYRTEWSLERLFGLAGISPRQAEVFRCMEEGFQRYLGPGSLPVRNMQRLMGTKITTLEQLLGARDGGMIQEETRSVRVRRILYHIDRLEYQDGCMVCAGWACAKTWDKRTLPVQICVTDGAGVQVPAEVTRRERQDVALVLKIRGESKPLWGFDCVWVVPQEAAWSIRFSLGKREEIYEG